MIDRKMPRWQQWAQFRFAVVGSLLSSPPEGGQLKQEILRSVVNSGHQIFYEESHFSLNAHS
jgi:hypothetical protein